MVLTKVKFKYKYLGVQGKLAEMEKLVKIENIITELILSLFGGAK